MAGVLGEQGRLESALAIARYAYVNDSSISANLLAGGFVTLVPDLLIKGELLRGSLNYKIIQGFKFI